MKFRKFAGLAVALGALAWGAKDAHASYSSYFISPAPNFTSVNSLNVGGRTSWAWLFDTPVYNVEVTAVDGTGYDTTQWMNMQVDYGVCVWAGTLDTSVFAFGPLDLSADIYDDNKPPQYLDGSGHATVSGWEM